MLLKEEKIKHSKGIRELSLPDHIAELGRDFRNMDPVSLLTEQLKAANCEIERLRAENKTIHERGVTEGFVSGQKEGFQKGVATIRARIDDLGQALQQLDKQQGHVIRSAEQFVVDFCFRIVEKILGTTAFRELQLPESRLRQITETALNEFSDSGKYIIRVHKGLAGTLQEYKEQVKQHFNRDVAVVIQDDPSLRPGDCVIETDYGVLDGRIDSQLNELKNIFSGGN